ncbi:peptidyl-prolyl cis-trans isomerase FKBP16-1, chloroplastic isoform X1 [Cinnamomum micranthum f. kanehirae]|uniref:peptidylprolyl isomerase n=1 Tax=Cinnamomum micranthum f. kanehirae TaxID=337451 RepID=A0A3S3NMF5_9MAGN|nr:peptidyl-prolyl cis-trans isomerase FKBP16-1, chloroplastic isoform X1 [Cinnamomum micranthum f. kanehirae]
MEGFRLHPKTPVHLKSSSIHQRQNFISNRKPWKIFGDGLSSKFACQAVCKLSRRNLFSEAMGFTFTATILHNCPYIAASLPEMKEADVIRSQKLSSGVRIQDIVEGEGIEAFEGDMVEINYVCRRSNGYFVHSTVDQFSGESRPVILRLDEEGLKEVLVGMKVGGKRRALIPPEVGYINANLKPIPDEGPAMDLKPSDQRMFVSL